VIPVAAGDTMPREVAMTIPLEFVTNQLTAQDDPKLWGEVLMVLGDEFLQRFRGEGDDKKVWYVRVGACSHWLGPHRVRWTVAGGFAAPVGYGGAGAFSFGLPEFDWSVILTFDGGRWNQVDKFSGKKQIVLRIAIPTRTAHHKQAAIHAVW
jgi:hypothetical protein